MSQNLQSRFSQCTESQDSSQAQSVSDESSDQLNESCVLRHESSQNSDDSQQEFERSEFERVISSSPISSQNFIPTSPQNESSQQSSQSESQNNGLTVGSPAETAENPPVFQTEIHSSDPAELGTNLDDFNKSEPVLNGPSGPQTISSQSSTDE